MINYELPTTLCVDGKEYEINRKGDYRIILDIISVFCDQDLTDQQKAYCALSIFYNFNIPENIESALAEMKRFIDCGEDTAEDNTHVKPRMDWEHDFNLIISPINKALGYEVRMADYLHWWTFVGGYMEIDGDCQFAMILNIRKKLSKGQKLEKWEREFYQSNRNRVNIPARLSKKDKAFLEFDL